ncbi:hypothetical protein R4Q14_04405 [Brachyspira intermedia]|uniref:hypothetical protein n=1 Tax=Brachyspira intermedia TaxID=84377 RepID=UPI0030061629
MKTQNKRLYYCFECKFAKRIKGALICSVYRGITDISNKACLDFELKSDFIRRKNK